MYLMVNIELNNFPEFDSDLRFVEKLVSDQSVMLLPGKCFDIDDFVRIVLTVPKPILMDALNRLQEFCAKYYVNRKQILRSIYENGKYVDQSEDLFKYKFLKNPNRKISEQKLISRFFDEMDL